MPLGNPTGVNDVAQEQWVKAEKFTHRTVAPTLLNTAGNITYTAAQILGGIVLRATNGASRSDTLPTAALFVAAMLGKASIGDTIAFKLINCATAAETITINAGSGGAFDANQTAASKIIGQNAASSMLIRITGVAAGSEAYVVYM